MRNRLARAQIELLAAVVADGPPPPGFDPDRLRIQAEALVAKRREVVARLRPDLVEAAGPDFRDRFDTYARGHPRPAGGARADVEAFARTLPTPTTSTTLVPAKTHRGRLARHLVPRAARRSARALARAETNKPKP